MVQLLEISLVDGVDKAPEARQPFSLDSLADLSLSVTGSSSGSEFDNYIKCGPQGIFFSNLVRLASYSAAASWISWY